MGSQLAARIPVPQAAPVVPRPRRRQSPPTMEAEAYEPFEPHALMGNRQLLGALGPGMPLPADVRMRMGRAFGEDLQDVRLHVDAAAASVAARHDAHALTVGRDIVFGAGAYRPGTALGDALLAHEIAHAVQQSGAAEAQVDALTPDPYPVVPDAELEADADLAAASATGVALGLGRGFDPRPRLRTGLQLSRCGKKTDFRRGTSLPDAARLAALRRELRPGSTSSSGAMLTWDGAERDALGNLTPAAVLARADLRSGLATRMRTHLDTALVDLDPTIHARTMPMTQFEGAGRAAKTVTDRKFAAWTGAAALTAPQEAARHDFRFRGSAGPGQTLFDAFDPAQRGLAGHPINPRDLADWISESDDDCATFKGSHNFDPTRGGEEAIFLRDEIVNPFAAANDADLRTYDRFGFAISGDKIVAPSSVTPGLSDVAGPHGRPSPAERHARWAMWELLVHEYLHKLEHPAFGTSTGSNGNRIMTEGFCELFTKEVLLLEIPRVRSNRALRVDIEGGDFGETPVSMVPPYDPGQYAEYLRHAENIRDTVIGRPGGENAVKAAFFQGHVEFIGLKPSGAEVTPIAPGTADVVNVPAGVTTLMQMVRASRVFLRELRAANPGVPMGGPLPPRMRAPGAREHLVVVARDGVSSRAETQAQIAKQNGVSESALARANPSVNWGTLTQGQRLLIPKH